MLKNYPTETELSELCSNLQQDEDAVPEEFKLHVTALLIDASFLLHHGLKMVENAGFERRNPKQT